MVFNKYKLNEILIIFIVRKDDAYNERCVLQTICLERGTLSMKKHKAWAWAMVFCLVMTMYTGKKKI